MSDDSRASRNVRQAWSRLNGRAAASVGADDGAEGVLMVKAKPEDLVRRLLGDLTEPEDHESLVAAVQSMTTAAVETAGAAYDPASYLFALHGVLAQAVTFGILYAEEARRDQ